MRIENKPNEPNITFTWKERIIIFTRGKLVFSPVNFKHFCNALFNILVEFQKKFEPKLQNITTRVDDNIKSS